MAAGRAPRRYAVIMAGGFGTRFWPHSRRALPKQFLRLSGRRSMLQETALRLRGLVPPGQVLVVAAPEFVARIRTQLPELPRANLIVEPAPRGTAACLALAAERIALLNGAGGEVLMAVFPADHAIADPARFRAALRRGFEVADRERCLVTFGVVPTRPETGYGYIEIGRVLQRRAPRVHWVVRFHEKPAPATARRYVRGRRHLWNAGIFVWRVDVIRALFARHAAATVAAARAVARRGGRGGVAARYRRLPSRSVDVAILERADRVAVVQSRFGWSDVGSWSAIGDVWGTDRVGNTRRGRVVLVDTRDTVVHGGTRLIAAVGVEDLVVVDSADAVLVCRKSDAQAVRRVIAALRRRGYGRYL